jgi:hypothetical protein
MKKKTKKVVENHKCPHDFVSKFSNDIICKQCGKVLPLEDGKKYI